MSACQDVLTETFMMLVGQQASAEVIFEVLLDEAASLFPALERQDLEQIILLVLDDADKYQSGGQRHDNVLEFPASKRAAKTTCECAVVQNPASLERSARIHE